MQGEARPISHRGCQSVGSEDNAMRIQTGSCSFGYPLL